MRELASLGGKATALKHDGEAFTADELDPIVTLEDAKAALDEIRIAAMSRRLTHAEANAASKAVSEWVRAESVAVTGRLVNELHAELEKQKAENAKLRTQIQRLGRTPDIR